MPPKLIPPALAVSNLSQVSINIQLKHILAAPVYCKLRHSSAQWTGWRGGITLQLAINPRPTVCPFVHLQLRAHNFPRAHCSEHWTLNLASFEQ